MDFVDKIVNDISTLNEFGKYNLIEQLLDKKLLDIGNIVGQYTKKNQYEIETLQAELMKTYITMGINSKESNEQFLREKGIIK